MNTAITARRRQTRNNIYRCLYYADDVCSRQMLAQELGLSMPTVHQNLSELIEAGLVRYSGEQLSTGGRKAQGLTIIPDARVAVGISITENRLRLVAADLYLKELAYQKVPIEPVANFSEFGGYLAQELERFLDQHQIDRSRLLGAGIALPAVISADRTKITLAPTLKMENQSLDGLARFIPCPTVILNDGTCGGYAEWFVRNTHRSMAYLSLENGVGGSVFVNGAPYIGNNQHSGEFGHMCVEPGGLPCSCGKSGCLEAYCSAHRISDDLGISLEQFFAGVEGHNPAYETLWFDLLRHLAIGINNIHMALDCDVVLGGFLTQYFAPYLPLLKSYVSAANIFTDDADYLSLSILRKHSVPLGAALHFVKEFLDNI